MQPLQESSPAHSQDDSDDVIIVDLLQKSQGKRKGGMDQPSTQPRKKQAFWVEVPSLPKRRGKPVPIKLEDTDSESDDDPQVAATASAVKDEPDLEIVTALAVIRSVSWRSNFLRLSQESNISIFVGKHKR